MLHTGCHRAYPDILQVCTVTANVVFASVRTWCSIDMLLLSCYIAHRAHCCLDVLDCFPRSLLPLQGTIRTCAHSPEAMKLRASGMPDNDQYCARKVQERNSLSQCAKTHPSVYDSMRGSRPSSGSVVAMLQRGQRLCKGLRLATSSYRIEEPESTLQEKCICCVDDGVGRRLRWHGHSVCLCKEVIKRSIVQVQVEYPGVPGRKYYHED